MVKPMFLLAVVVVLVAVPASAQSGSGDAPTQKEVRPPAPAEPGKPNLVVPYLLSFVIGGAAVGLAVLPSGRTHKD